MLPLKVLSAMTVLEDALNVVVDRDIVKEAIDHKEEL
jgi:hypothetical protein